MAIIYTTGDIFANKHRVQAFAHGCNCAGAMGKGIALSFRTRYPLMYVKYRKLCRDGTFSPGSVFLWKDKERPWVANLGTQDSWQTPAKIEYIKHSFSLLNENIKKWEINSLAMPAIGAGLGGLDWEEVKSTIDIVFKSSLIPIYIYETFHMETI